MHDENKQQCSKTDKSYTNSTSNPNNIGPPVSSTSSASSPIPRYTLICNMSDLFELPVELVNEICSHLSPQSLNIFINSSIAIEKLSRSVLDELLPAEKLWIFKCAANSPDQDPLMQNLLPDLLEHSRTNPLLGVQALLCACANGHVQSVSTLLDGGVDPNSTVAGVSALMEAVAGQDYRSSALVTGRILARGADIHARDSKGLTALHYAAKGGNTRIINLLLMAGCSVHGTGAETSGTSPIMLASQKGQYSAVETLIDHGADVNDRDKLRRTPLIYAVNESKTSVVRLLISRGAELDFGSVFGKTTLHYACEKGSVEIVKLLVDAGCDVSHQDMQGNTALQLCSQSSPTFTVITDIIHDRLERRSS